VTAKLPTTVSSDTRAAALYPLNCNSSEAEAAASNAPRLELGDTTFYTGATQLSSTNQDPRLLRFDAGKLSWCRDDLETSSDDGRGYGLLWNGKDSLYAVFSATGTQGEPSGDFRRFAVRGWLKSYADASWGGGGAKVSILAKLDPATGDILAATYLTAVRPSDQKINSLTVTDLRFKNDTLTVSADAFYSPRQTNKEPFNCSGTSPFAYQIVFNADLSKALRASAEGCNP